MENHCRNNDRQNVYMFEKLKKRALPSFWEVTYREYEGQ